MSNPLLDAIVQLSELRPKPPHPIAAFGAYIGPITLSTHCWEVKGALRDSFHDTAHAEIKDHLQNFFGSVPNENRLTICFYLIGKAPCTASPTVMFISENSEYRKDARKAIKESGILKQYPGFKTAEGAKDPGFQRMEQLASKSDSNDTTQHTMPMKDVLYDPTSTFRSSGFPIYVQHSSSLRQATASAIRFGDRVFFQTAYHAFIESPNTSDNPASTDAEFDMDSDSDSETEDDVDLTSIGSRTPDSFDDLAGLGIDSSVCSGPSALSSQSTPLSERVSSPFSEETNQTLQQVTDCLTPYTMNRQNYEPRNYTLPSPETLSSLGRLSDWSVDKDWALIEVASAEVNAFLLAQPKLSLSIDNIAAPPKTNAAVTASTISGQTLQGTLSALPLPTRFPGGTCFQTVYAVRFTGPLAYGDCGALITDASSGQAYGHIVAGCLATGSAYILASEEVVAALMRQERVSTQESMKETLGTSTKNLLPASQIKSSRRLVQNGHLGLKTLLIMAVFPTAYLMYFLTERSYKSHTQQTLSEGSESANHNTKVEDSHTLDHLSFAAVTNVTLSALTLSIDQAHGLAEYYRDSRPTLVQWATPIMLLLFDVLPNKILDLIAILFGAAKLSWNKLCLLPKIIYGLFLGLTRIFFSYSRLLFGYIGSPLSWRHSNLQPRASENSSKLSKGTHLSYLQAEYWVNLSINVLVVSMMGSYYWSRISLPFIKERFEMLVLTLPPIQDADLLVALLFFGSLNILTESRNTYDYGGRGTSNNPITRRPLSLTWMMGSALLGISIICFQSSLVMQVVAFSAFGIILWAIISCLAEMVSLYPLSTVLSTRQVGSLPWIGLLSCSPFLHTALVLVLDSTYKLAKAMPLALSIYLLDLCVIANFAALVWFISTNMKPLSDREDRSEQRDGDQILEPPHAMLDHLTENALSRHNSSVLSDFRSSTWPFPYHQNYSTWDRSSDFGTILLSNENLLDKLSAARYFMCAINYWASIYIKIVLDFVLIAQAGSSMATWILPLQIRNDIGKPIAGIVSLSTIAFLIAAVAFSLLGYLSCTRAAHLKLLIRWKNAMGSSIPMFLRSTLVMLRFFNSSTLDEWYITPAILLGFMMWALYLATDALHKLSPLFVQNHRDRLKGLARLMFATIIALVGIAIIAGPWSKPAWISRRLGSEPCVFLLPSLCLSLAIFLPWYAGMYLSGSVEEARIRMHPAGSTVIEADARDIHISSYSMSDIGMQHSNWDPDEDDSVHVKIRRSSRSLSLLLAIVCLMFIGTLVALTSIGRFRSATYRAASYDSSLDEAGQREPIYGLCPADQEQYGCYLSGFSAGCGFCGFASDVVVERWIREPWARFLLLFFVVQILYPLVRAALLWLFERLKSYLRWLWTSRTDQNQRVLGMY